MCQLCVQTEKAKPVDVTAPFGTPSARAIASVPPPAPQNPITAAGPRTSVQALFQKPLTCPLGTSTYQKTFTRESEEDMTKALLEAERWGADGEGITSAALPIQAARMRCRITRPDEVGEGPVQRCIQLQCGLGSHLHVLSLTKHVAWQCHPCCTTMQSTDMCLPALVRSSTRGRTMVYVALVQCLAAVGWVELQSLPPYLATFSIGRPHPAD